MNELKKTRVHRYSKGREQFNKLYEEAFPRIERLPVKLMMSYIDRPGIELWNFYLEEEYAGFAYMLLSDKYAYLLYFAIPEALRGQGLGSSVVKSLRELYRGRDMVLDIEPPDSTAPNSEQRKGRLRFYQNLGFSPAGFEMTDETGDYSILTTDPESFDKEAFGAMFDIIPPVFYGTKIVPAKERA